MSRHPLYQLFCDPAKWTRNALARNKNGVSVSTYDDSAESFCLVGGIMRSYPVGMRSPAIQKLEAAIRLLRPAAAEKAVEFGKSLLPFFNDRFAAHQDILQVVKEAGV